jgi:hypothetical protein
MRSSTHDIDDEDGDEVGDDDVDALNKCASAL